MKVLETYVLDIKGITSLLYKCDNGRKAGRWYHAHTGAFGQRDMKLQPIGPKAAAALLAEHKAESEA